MARILIIDDDEQICGLLAKMVQRMGHEASLAHTGNQGRQMAAGDEYDLIFLDVGLPDGNGLELIPDLRVCPGEPEVVIITGAGDASGAELAIKSGAWDYLEKGTSLGEIALPITRALQYREEKQASRAPVSLKRTGIVGESPLMHACYDLLAQAAASELSVLITGETGTGKELFARAIHDNSNRSRGRFVVVDCAALPQTLVESTLFGHVKGAFTGADRSQEGLIKQADGGTLFLDEVGELPFSVQKSFLRVLQERRFRPVGSNAELASNFRLLAATNRRLDEMVAGGKFRDDLLFRLKALVIDLPPLRERKEDIRDLVLWHLDRLCMLYGIKNKGFSPSFLQALMHYEWPGNVRELMGALELALTSAGESPTLFHKHLPDEIRIAAAQKSLQKPAVAEQTQVEPTEDAEPLPPLAELLAREADKTERWYLEELMGRAGGDIQEACRISGLGRSSLYQRLKKHGLTRRRAPRL